MASSSGEARPSRRGDALKKRARIFAASTIRLAQQLPRDPAARVIADQLIRSATSVAANYGAACRARSRREFISKLCIATEEADETQLWLDLLGDLEMAPLPSVTALRSEADEFIAIFVASIGTARRRVGHT